MIRIRTRKFTGWHMLAILVGFFGVVVAVNMTMATLAMKTFGGTVVDNSYVAGQRFNGWLAEARAQERLGWHTRLALDDERRVTLALSDGSAPLAGAVVTAVARHPLGRAPAVTLTFRVAAPGSYVARVPLPAGRWLVHVEIRRAGRDLKLIQTLS